MANEPDLTQRLTVTFENIANLPVSLDTTPQIINADFGNVYPIEHSKVLCGTTEYWNNQPELVTQSGYLYIYSDYKQNEQEQDVAGFKVGDGTSYLIELPFTDSVIYEQIQDTSANASMYHLGFYLDENGGLCQVNSI